MPFRINPFTRKLDLVDINSIPPGALDSITGNSGGAVGPDGSNDITFTASGGFTVIGTPGTFSLNLAPTGWTAGSVIFASSATAFSQDNANFFYDSGTSSLLLGTTTPLASSILTLSSTTKGFRPPSMTTAQRNAIAAPASGILVYDNTLNDLQYYNGSSWVSSAGVTSVTGTANQITASPTTGDVVLSLTNGISLGSYQATSPPTGGIIAPGTVGFGTNSPDATSQMQITTALGRVLTITGTQTSNDGAGRQRGIDIANTYAPAGGSGTVYVVSSHPTFAIPGAQSVTDAACFHASPSYTANAGTIPQSYGFYYDGGNALPGGVISTAYGGYFAVPAAGTNRVALFATNAAIGSSYTNVSIPSNGALIQGNVSIGTTSNANKLDVAGAVAIGSYAGTAAPSNGLIVSGSVSIGTSTPAASALLTLSSTTQGFLPPSMNNTQRNAISSPASGLVIYSTTDNDLEFWNGSSWIGSSTSGVTSIAGTANQISASASTGAVTLSLTNGISIGSYQATSPPTGGAIIPGRVGIGTSAPSSTAQMEVDMQSSLPVGTYVGGTCTAVTGSIQVEYWSASTLSPTNGSSASVFHFMNGTVSAPSGRTITLAAGTFTQLNLNTNVGTITDAIGFYISSGSAGAGTITRATGLKVVTPVAGTTNICAAFDGGISVGNSYVTTAPPSSGAIIQGQTLIGSSSSALGGRVEITAASADIAALYVKGTNTAKSSNRIWAIVCDTQLNPTGGASDRAVILELTSSIVAPTATTIDKAIALFTNMNWGLNVGTITTAYNAYIGAGTSGAGTITTAYGLYVQNPTCATTNYCAAFDGYVGIGTMAPQAPLQLSATPGASNQGMLHIRPASGQKGYITFTENSVADRGGIGFDNASGTMKLVTNGLPGAGTAYLTITSAGVVEIVNRMKYNADTTGAGTPLLGSNCPASTLAAPYTWFSMTSSDGSVVYLPAWK